MGDNRGNKASPRVFHAKPGDCRSKKAVAAATSALPSCPLYIVGRQYLTFDSLDFQGGYEAVKIDCSARNRYITITNCNIGYRSGTGVFLTADPNAIQADHVTIAYCNIASGAPPYITTAANKYIADGLTIRACDYVSIHDNTLSDWGHTAIYLHAQADAASDTGGFVRYGEVYNNTITAPNIYCRGISTDAQFDGQCSYNKVHHNTIRNTTIRSQINGDHNEFYLNTIDGVRQPAGYPTIYMAGEGLQLQGYEGPCHDNIIRGNIIKNCDGPGIRVDGGYDDANKYDNIITDNIISNCGTSNRFSDYTHVGLRVGAYKVLDNTYANNHIYASSASSWSGMVYYRNTLLTVAEFNARNTQNGDVIRGTTFSVGAP